MGPRDGYHYGAKAWLGGLPATRSDRGNAMKAFGLAAVGVLVGAILIALLLVGLFLGAFFYALGILG